MINHDPILDIRTAVVGSLNEYQYGLSRDEKKTIVDGVVDRLPDFFRQPLAAATIESSADSCEAAMIAHTRRCEFQERLDEESQKAEAKS